MIGCISEDDDDDDDNDDDDVLDRFEECDGVGVDENGETINCWTISSLLFSPSLQLPLPVSEGDEQGMEVVVCFHGEKLKSFIV